MPSTLPGFLSGGAALCSGDVFSGQLSTVIGGIQVKVATGVSGLVYLGATVGPFSGGITQNSGGAFTSGGLSDGIELANGDSFFVPRSMFQTSGGGYPDPSLIKIVVPPAISGQIRVFWYPL